VNIFAYLTHLLTYLLNPSISDRRLDTLCIAALDKLRARKYDTGKFISIAVEAERWKLMEGKRFRDRMVG
jgi:hypothetical protein